MEDQVYNEANEMTFKLLNEAVQFLRQKYGAGSEEYEDAVQGVVDAAFHFVPNEPV